MTSENALAHAGSDAELRPIAVRYSVIVPVYGNEPTLPVLVAQIRGLAADLDGSLEVVFVVDGSPDGSLPLLRRLLAEEASFGAQLIALSRNFGCRRSLQAPYVAVRVARHRRPI